jgi:murein tripeptide amidase MpaA
MAKEVLALLAFALLVSFSVAQEEARVRYDGHRVLRITTRNQQEVEMLRRVLPNDTDIWTREGVLGVGTNDIRTGPERAVEKVLDALGIPWEIFVPDVQDLIDQEWETNANSSRIGKRQSSWYNTYHTYDEILARLRDVASAYPNIATFIPSIGTSIQGRAIFGIKITGSTNANAQSIFFQGGQHAREWIGPATVMYITEKLLTGYGSDATVTSWINNQQFHIFPLANPDGYVYAWNTDRMWRKNRRSNSGGSFGVDMNRNWDDHWGGAGSSGTPTSDTYRGTAPFSEPETAALSRYILALPNRKGAIDFHSYSQLFLRPYGWTSQNCPHESLLNTAGANIVRAIQSYQNRVYQNIRSIDLYVTTGSASDWFYYSNTGRQQGNMVFAHTIELRDTGQYGFILPANQIIPTGEENWAGLRIWITEAIK